MIHTVPWHFPTCRCAGSGWLDTKPTAKYGRQYDTVARCGVRGPLSRDEWTHWLRHHPDYR